MAINNTTYRVFLEKLGGTDPSQFVGDEGEVFLDPNIPALKLSDGSTPGGVAIGVTGIGTTAHVTFSASYNVGTNQIQVLADTTTDPNGDQWSFRIVPIEIQEYQD